MPSPLRPLAMSDLPRPRSEPRGIVMCGVRCPAVRARRASVAAGPYARRGESPNSRLPWRERYAPPDRWRLSPANRQVRRPYTPKEQGLRAADTPSPRRVEPLSRGFACAPSLLSAAALGGGPWEGHSPLTAELSVCRSSVRSQERCGQRPDPHGQANGWGSKCPPPVNEAGGVTVRQTGWDASSGRSPDQADAGASVGSGTL